MDNDSSMLVAGLAQRVVGQIEQATGLKQELLDQQLHAARMNDSDTSAVKRKLRREQEENRKLQEALSQKEALLKEWMHSNEAFKRLARKYGKQVGVSDEQRQMDWNEAVVEVANENPDYENTDLAKKKRQEVGKLGI